MTQTRAPARERCAYCGRPANGRCSNCNRPYCSEHGVVLCTSCSEPLRPLPSAPLYRGAVVVFAVCVVLGAGLLLQPWPSSVTASVSNQDQVAANGTPASGQQEPTVSPASYIEYVITAGDTLESLAGRFQTSVDAISTLNPGLSPTSLQLGQTIRVPNAPATTLPTPPSPPTSTPTPAPTATPAPPAFIEHVVGPGDNLSYIASLYGTTVNTLVSVNGLSVNSLLSLGQVIRVPR